MENKAFNIKKWSDSSTPEAQNSNDIKWETPTNDPSSTVISPTNPPQSHPADRIRDYGQDKYLPKSKHPEVELKQRPGWVSHDENKEFGFNRSEPTTKTVFSVKSTSFLLDCYNEHVIQELQQSNIKLENNTEVYEFPSQGELAEVTSYTSDMFRKILNKTSTLGMKIKDCRLYKIDNGESIINYNSSLNSEFNFIYTIQSDSKVGNHIGNLSLLGGPTFNYPTPIKNVLTIFPGWIPFHFSKNNSNKEFIAIVGSLETV